MCNVCNSPNMTVQMKSSTALIIIIISHEVVVWSTPTVYSYYFMLIHGTLKYRFSHSLQPRSSVSAVCLSLWSHNASSPLTSCSTWLGEKARRMWTFIWRSTSSIYHKTQNISVSAMPLCEKALLILCNSTIFIIAACMVFSCVFEWIQGLCSLMAAGRTGCDCKGLWSSESASTITSPSSQSFFNL